MMLPPPTPNSSPQHRGQRKGDQDGKGEHGRLRPWARASEAPCSSSSLAFVGINCAALPEDLIESELFGAERGAYSGATTSRPGLFEPVGEGTLFLDEVGEMSLGM